MFKLKIVFLMLACVLLAAVGTGRRVKRAKKATLVVLDPPVHPVRPRPRSASLRRNVVGSARSHANQVGKS